MWLIVGVTLLASSMCKSPVALRKNLYLKGKKPVANQGRVSCTSLGSSRCWPQPARDDWSRLNTDPITNSSCISYSFSRRGGSHNPPAIVKESMLVCLASENCRRQNRDLTKQWHTSVYDVQSPLTQAWWEVERKLIWNRSKESHQSCGNLLAQQEK